MAEKFGGRGGEGLGVARGVWVKVQPCFVGFFSTDRKKRWIHFVRLLLINHSVLVPAADERRYSMSSAQR